MFRMNLLNLNYPESIQSLSYYHERFMIFLLNRINEEKTRDNQKTKISHYNKGNVETKRIHIPGTFKDKDFNRLISEFGLGVINNGDSNRDRNTPDS